MTPKNMPGGKGWRLEVAAEFRRLGELYADTDNSYRQRKIASAMIAQMTRRFAELGIFEDDSDAAATAPIVKTLGMFSDLELGRRHEWSEPAAIGGSRTERTAAREIRLWALAATSLLIDSGAKPSAAFKEVAVALSSAGHDCAPGGVKSWWYRVWSESEARRVADAKAAFLKGEATPSSLKHARRFLSSPLLQMVGNSF